jgi:hypothetical protein
MDATAEHGAVPDEHSAPGRERLPRRLRHRSAVATAGVGLVLAGGSGGFAVGHAVTETGGSGSGVSTDAVPHGVPGGPRDGAGHGGPPGFDRDGDTQDGAGPVPDQSTPDGSGSSSGDDDAGTA